MVSGEPTSDWSDRSRKSSGVRLRRPEVPLRRTVHCFPNDVDRVAEFVDELLGERPLGEEDRGALALSLRELLLNAIEHGNLGLSFEDKANALAAGTWKQTVATRAKLAPYSDRSTRVTAIWEPHRVAFAIADEGAGFDWRALPDPTDPDNILRDNGRGVLMARLSVDSLEYNATGNQVTIVKNLG